jgi:phage baseplate assembly protein gpV
VGAPRQDSLDNTQYGVHYGVVTQNKDPNGLNRIKVKLPWLDNGDTDQSGWAQLMTPMGGDKFGWHTLPDVNDVVVISFIAGDMSQPVIMGGVWSTTDNSPETNEDGKNNFRGYRSRSGHRLILDDTDKTKVVVADKTGKNMIGIGNFAKSGAGPNACAVFKPPMSGDTGVSISSMEGTMEITCKDGTLSLEATNGSIKINTTQAMNMKMGGAVKMEGTSTAKLTSGSPSNLDASTINIA